MVAMAEAEAPPFVLPPEGSETGAGAGATGDAFEGGGWVRESKPGLISGAGTGSGFFSAISSDVTISTAIGSAVAEPNGCTSLNSSTSTRIDRCAITEAAMPVRMACPGST